MEQAQVRIEVTDPAEPAARYCLRAYFEELARRFDGGFDPARSISASERAGFVEVDAFNGEPYAHHWFERPVPGDGRDPR